MFSASNLKRGSPNLILLTIQSCLTVRRPRIHALSGSISARHFRSPSSIRVINSVAGSFIPAPPFVTAKTPRFLRFPCIQMVETQKRFHSTDKKHGGVENHNHETKHTIRGHRNGEENGHAHSFSVFGHSHSHEEQHARDADQLIAALKGSGDRGSYITLVGLLINIALTTGKGLAGWYMHSASLVADAGHSLSDLLGDFVTLFCWRLSRKPPSARYPYGFAKFETFGTTTISILLIGGALGIGFHSYHLLIHALGHSVLTLPPGTLHDILQYITSTAPVLPFLGHGHVHSVDPNAAWFAGLSVLLKEWLYRITKVVADEEKSPVLLANAIHHRSDAYSSLVAFFAILGSWFFPALPLDPIGGLLVSIVILRQGFGLFVDAVNDLADAGISPLTRRSLLKILDPLTQQMGKATQNGDASIPPISISHLRARHAGSLMFVDLTASVPGSITVAEAATLEEKIEHMLKKERKEIKEVRVTFRPTGTS